MKHDPNLRVPKSKLPFLRAYMGPRKPFALRAFLLHDVVHSRSIEELQSRLCAKGYTLGVDAEHTCVLQALSGVTLCKASAIGIDRLGDAGVVCH
jgi:hypothetical protein